MSDLWWQCRHNTNVRILPPKFLYVSVFAIIFSFFYLYLPSLPVSAYCIPSTKYLRNSCESSCLPSRNYKNGYNHTFLNTNLRLETIACGDTTLFFFDSAHNFSSAQKIHQSFLVHWLECILRLNYYTSDGVYNIICITALKKHVFPKLFNPEPILYPVDNIGGYYNLYLFYIFNSFLIFAIFMSIHKYIMLGLWIMVVCGLIFKC